MVRINKNVPALLRELKRLYRGADCALDHKNAFELLVATILSAQCTDERVNLVTKSLFAKYGTPAKLAAAGQAEIEREVRSTGFFRNKAKNIRGASKALLDRHGGRVPSEMDQLLSLPGVARKTANVVLGNAYGIAEGVVVDTHVMRLSARLGLSSQTTPEKIEKDLMRLIPRRDWIWISHALIRHGRTVCRAISPRCPDCPVRTLCPNRVN